MMLNKRKCISLTALWVITSGVTIILLRTAIFDIILSSTFVLNPNSLIVNLWQHPSIMVQTNFYFFNWTNPEQIHDLSIKPAFKQTGPYSFKEQVDKVNVTWNSNDTVTFKLLRTWYFDEQQSGGKLTDQITTINAITATAAHKMQDWNYFTKRSFSLSLGMVAPKIHVVKSADQLLFKGYQDPYIDFAQNLPFADDILLTFTKFGWMFARNNSYKLDGVFNMATSAENLGEFLKWNDVSQTPFYENTCGKVEGALPQLYPQRQKKDFIGMFVPYACRNIKLDYEKDVSVKNIDGYKYSGQDRMLDNGTRIPENKCFCNGKCTPSGILNVSACAAGMPSFLSLPHFYGADPVYLDKVEGLRPEKSKHEMYVVVEPRTGGVLDISLRLQLNMLLHPVEHITLFEHIPEILFPVLWFEQKVTIDDNLAWAVRILMHIPTIILPAVGTILIIIGAFFLTLANYKSIVKFLRKRSGFVEVPLEEKSACSSNTQIKD